MSVGPCECVWVLQSVKCYRGRRKRNVFKKKTGRKLIDGEFYYRLIEIIEIIEFYIYNAIIIYSIYKSIIPSMICWMLVHVLQIFYCPILLIQLPYRLMSVNFMSLATYLKQSIWVHQCLTTVGNILSQNLFWSISNLHKLWCYCQILLLSCYSFSCWPALQEVLWLSHDTLPMF